MLGRHIANCWPSNDLIVSFRNPSCETQIDLAGPISPEQIPAGIRNVVVVAAQMPKPSVPVSAFVEVNALGVLRLAEACAARGVETLVHVSSIFASYPPSHPRHDAYAISKKMGEVSIALLRKSLVMQQGSESSMAIANLRMGVLYGSCEAYSRSTLLVHLAESIVRGETIVFTGSNNSRRSMTHVDDAVAAIITVCNRKLSGTYTCVSHDSTLTDLVNEIASALGVVDTPEVRFSGAGESVPDAIFLDDGAELLSDIAVWSTHTQFSVTSESICPPLERTLLRPDE
jgi:nucleoside-diphosphate-sugar epimerase